MAPGEQGVGHVQQAAVRQLLEARCERLCGPPRTALEVGAPELGKRLRDDQPAELEQLRTHHDRDEPAGEGAQVGLDVHVPEGGDQIVEGLPDLVDRRERDRLEQALLVGEVLVDGLLRDAGDRRDSSMLVPR